MAYSRKPLICKIDDLPRVLKMILAHQLLYATKPRDDEWSKKKWSWREFFSELIKPPIPPHLIQVVPPFLVESNPVYMIQMSGEAAWKCREFYWLPHIVFDLLQASMLPLGYKLNESSCDRVGHIVGEDMKEYKWSAWTEDNIFLLPCVAVVFSPKEKGELKACETQKKRTRTGTNQPVAQTRGGHVSCSLLLAASWVTFISFRRNKCKNDLQT